jgi:hypothetical protein
MTLTFINLFVAMVVFYQLGKNQFQSTGLFLCGLGIGMGNLFLVINKINDMKDQIDLLSLATVQ